MPSSENQNQENVDNNENNTIKPEIGIEINLKRGVFALCTTVKIIVS